MSRFTAQIYTRATRPWILWMVLLVGVAASAGYCGWTRLAWAHYDSPNPGANREQQALSVTLAIGNEIVFVNRNDDDGDNVPDYADLAVSGETGFVPVTLTVAAPDGQAFPNPEAVRIRIVYAGEAALGLLALEHYWRYSPAWPLPQHPRCVSDSALEAHAMQWVPALMSYRQNPFPDHTYLSIPYGAGPSQGLARANSVALHDCGPTADAAIRWPNAPNLNHSSEDRGNSHGGFRGIPFPRIYEWYERYYNAGSDPALRLGRDH